MPELFCGMSQRGSWPVVLLLLLLAGCAGRLQPVSPDQLTMAQPGGNAIILAQFRCRAPPSPLWFPGLLTRESQIPDLGTVELVLGDGFSGGLPKWADSRKDFHHLSSRALAEGWIALLKPPGYYYLYVVALAGPSVTMTTALGGLSKEPSFKINPVFRIEAPPGANVIYAGSFRIDCPGWGDFYNGPTILFLPAAIEDQHQAAADVARREMPSQPPPVTRLAERHHGPLLFGVPAP